MEKTSNDANFNKDDQSIHKRLYTLRVNANHSQQEVAEYLGTTRQQIYKYEYGIQDMTLSRLIKLCKYYGVSADYILGLPKGLEWPE